MEAKAEYKVKGQNYLFESFLHDLPTAFLIDVVLEAQSVACQEIRGMERNPARVELFWTTYNFEFRQQIERWVRENA